VLSWAATSIGGHGKSTSSPSTAMRSPSLHAVTSTRSVMRSWVSGRTSGWRSISTPGSPLHPGRPRSPDRSGDTARCSVYPAGRCPATGVRFRRAASPGWPRRGARTRTGRTDSVHSVPQFADDRQLGSVRISKKATTGELPRSRTTVHRRRQRQHPGHRPGISRGRRHCPSFPNNRDTAQLRDARH
jgi:hypothetical protein